MRNIINKVSLIQLAFAGVTLRYLILGSGISDAIVFIAICSLMGAYTYLKTKQIPEPSSKMQKDVEELKGAISSIKLASGFKRQEGANEPAKRLF